MTTMDDENAIRLPGNPYSCAGETRGLIRGSPETIVCDYRP